MNATMREVGRDFRGERYIAGLLLILGFLLLLPGVQLFVVSQNHLAIPNWARSIDRHAWERNLVSAGVAVTLFGLVILEAMLRQAGDTILSRLGLVSFTLGTVMWLTVNALNLDRGGWVAELETYFIVFAFLATAFYSGAILRTRLLPVWIGVVSILWSLGMLIFVLPGNRGPLFYEPAWLLIGIALLMRRVQVPAAETAAQGAR
jgi:hypothetical protein